MATSKFVRDFLPSVNGFHFENSFPKGIPDVVVSVPLHPDITIGDASTGVCGGMAFAVMDLFHRQPPLYPPADTIPPQKGQLLTGYITQRLIESFNIPDGVLKYYEWMATPDHDTVIQRGLASLMILDEWPLIKADIDSGRLVCLGIVVHASTDPTLLGDNHQVVAYGYELDDGDTLTLHVYDPNSPPNVADQVTIALNLTNPAHTTPITSNIQTRFPMRGFFRVEYTAKDASGIAAALAGNVEALSRFPGGQALDLWTGDGSRVSTAFYNDANRPWTGWNPILPDVAIGIASGAPVVTLARYPDGRQLDLWITGNDGQAHTGFYNDATPPWHGWAPLGAPPSRLPAGAPIKALSRLPGGSALDLWVTGNDGQIYTAFYNDHGKPWSNWFPIVGIKVDEGGNRVPVAPAGAPVEALARYPDGKQLDIWVTGNDGQVYTAFYNDNGRPWTTWISLVIAVPGGLPPGAPVKALSRYPGGAQLDLWVTGRDNRVYTAFYNDAGKPWTGWFPIAGAVPGGVTPGTPIEALSRSPDGKQLDLWVAADDGQVYTAFYNDADGNWHGWASVAGEVPGGLPPRAPVKALARYPDGHQLDIFIRGRNGEVYTAFYNDANGHWQGWARIPGDGPSGL